MPANSANLSATIQLEHPRRTRCRSPRLRSCLGSVSQRRYTDVCGISLAELLLLLVIHSVANTPCSIWRSSLILSFASCYIMWGTLHCFAARSLPHSLYVLTCHTSNYLSRPVASSDCAAERRFATRVCACVLMTDGRGDVDGDVVGRDWMS